MHVQEKTQYTEGAGLSAVSGIHQVSGKVIPIDKRGLL